MEGGVGYVRAGVGAAARLGSVWAGWNIEEGSGPGLLIQDI